MGSKSNNRRLVKGSTGGGTTILADNGITDNAGVFELGGTLIKNTNIAQATFNMSFTGGKVGIGTSSPGVALHVEDNSGVRIKSPTAGYGDMNFIPYSPASSYDGIDFNSGEEIRIGGYFGARTGRFAFLASANNARIGINQANPLQTLSVKGEGTTSASYVGEFSSNDGSVIMSLRDDGHIGIGTNSMGASTIFEISSTEKGAVFSRMTEAQRDLISDPEASMLIYNTSTNKYNMYNGVSWEEITSA